jgi:hypothetical protein
MKNAYILEGCQKQFSKSRALQNNMLQNAIFLKFIL